jgi:hypothetical protein
MAGTCVRTGGARTLFFYSSDPKVKVYPISRSYGVLRPAEHVRWKGHCTQIR